jgi:hypothetical protein
MSQLSRRIFAAVAVSLTLGAVQFASGRDLAGIRQNRSGTENPSGTPATAINRVAKADRAVRVAEPAVPTQTISLRPDGLSDTSVLVRVPIARASRKGSSAPALLRSGDRKFTVACEPVVSVLTEIAKRLQPGRCVT